MPKLARLEGDFAQPIGPDGEADAGHVVCFSKGNDAHEIVIRTLTGEFVPAGENHGRKMYRKKQDPSLGGFVDVWLYFWDDRDGPTFTGWWFGNKLGGTEVWARSRSTDLLPPSSGWCIPWDGMMRPTLSIAQKAGDAASRRLEKDLQDGLMAAGQVHERTSRIEADYERAGFGSATDKLKEAEAELLKHTEALGVLGQRMMDAQNGMEPELAACLFGTLMGRLSAALQDINSRHSSIQAALSRAQEVLSSFQNGPEGSALQAAMSALRESVNAADDLVEKTAITAEMATAVESEGDDLAHSTALEQAEAASKSAYAALSTASAGINQQTQSLNRCSYGPYREKAFAELADWRKRLETSQRRLMPLKHLRQEYEKRKAARSVVEEALQAIVLSEVVLDRAVLAIDDLGAEWTLHKETAAKEAITHAEESVQTARLTHDAKRFRVMANPELRDELTKLATRCASNANRVKDLHARMQAVAEVKLCAQVVGEVGDKVQAVEDAIAKADEAEKLFAEKLESISGEENPGADVAAEAQRMEEATAKAQAVYTSTRIFVLTKQVEVRRYKADGGPVVSSQLQGCLSALESSNSRLSVVKARVEERKRTALARDADAKVENVEALTQISQRDVDALRAALAPEAADAEKSGEASEAVEEIHRRAAASEKLATQAITATKAFIAQKQVEIRGKPGNSADLAKVFIRYMARVAAADRDVVLHRTALSNAKEVVACRGVVAEANSKIRAMQEAVTESNALADALVELVSGETEQETKEVPPEGTEKDVLAEMRKIKSAGETLSRDHGALQKWILQRGRESKAVREALNKLQPSVRSVAEAAAALQTRAKQMHEKVRNYAVLKAKAELLERAKGKVLHMSFTERLGCEVVEEEIFTIGGCDIGIVGDSEPPCVLEVEVGSILHGKGVHTDDCLFSINGNETKGMTKDEVVAALKDVKSLCFQRLPKELPEAAEAAPQTLAPTLSKAGQPPRGPSRNISTLAPAMAKAGRLVRSVPAWGGPRPSWTPPRPSTSAGFLAARGRGPSANLGRK